MTHQSTDGLVSRRRLLRLAGAALFAAAAAPLLTADGRAEPAHASVAVLQPTHPELAGFKTYYGIQVSYIGEDGAMIALGHHDRRVTIAAMNRHARLDCGLANMLDDPRATYDDVEGWLHERWAVELTDRCRECDDDPACRECQALRARPEGVWCLQWSTEAADGSFPVMIWYGW